MTSHSLRRYVNVGELRLHYLEWGDPGRLPLLVVHGIGDNCHTWEPFAAMASAAFHIIALDQRGHGNSDWSVPPAYSCEDYVRDLGAVIDQLNFEKFILMGHSMGALHCTTYASLRPQRVAALIHIDIEPHPLPWNRQYLLGLYKSLPESYDSESDFIGHLRQNAPYARKDILCRLASVSLKKIGDGRLANKCDREVYAHFDPSYDLRKLLHLINAPALVIRGQESRVMSSEAARTMISALPRGELIEIPSATHPVHLDNPEYFGRAVLDFLQRLGMADGVSNPLMSKSW